MHCRTAAIVGLTLSTLPWIAAAHVGGDVGAHRGFADGFAHPFGGLDHLLAMLAVGLWSALVASRPAAAQYMRMPATFAMVLLAGAMFGRAGVVLPAVEPMIAVSLLVLGLMLAARRNLPPAAGSLLVGGFALFHGLAHGQELGGAGALGGMVLATLLLHAIGLLIGHVLRRQSLWWPRITGAATMAFGASLLLG